MAEETDQEMEEAGVAREDNTLKYYCVVVEWYDIATYTNDCRDSYTGGTPNITAGFLYKEYKVKGVKYTRLITNALVLKGGEISNTDDFIDIPSGTIRKITRYKKHSLGENDFLKSATKK